ncbi:transglycosylase family protein [Pseudonocardia sp. MCCB 268]|nr:transglycosylase family protein [Pseudonocardia cytotoxica]
MRSGPPRPGLSASDLMAHQCFPSWSSTTTAASSSSHEAQPCLRCLTPLLPHGLRRQVHDPDNPATWKAFGGQGEPHQASKEQQIAVAEKVQDEQGWKAWPSCSKKLGLARPPGTLAVSIRRMRDNAPRPRWWLWRWRACCWFRCPVRGAGGGARVGRRAAGGRPEATGRATGAWAGRSGRRWAIGLVGRGVGRRRWSSPVLGGPGRVAVASVARDGGTPRVARRVLAGRRGVLHPRLGIG